MPTKDVTLKDEKCFACLDCSSWFTPMAMECSTSWKETFLGLAVWSVLLTAEAVLRAFFCLEHCYSSCPVETQSCIGAGVRMLLCVSRRLFCTDKESSTCLMCERSQETVPDELVSDNWHRALAWKGSAINGWFQSWGNVCACPKGWTQWYLSTLCGTSSCCIVRQGCLSTDASRASRSTWIIYLSYVSNPAAFSPRSTHWGAHEGTARVKLLAASRHNFLLRFNKPAAVTSGCWCWVPQTCLTCWTRLSGEDSTRCCVAILVCFGIHGTNRSKHEPPQPITMWSVILFHQKAM